MSLDPARLVALNDHPPAEGEYVLYWMQQSQRAEYNHALEHAAAEANRLGLPLVVCFGLMDDYPEANVRHYLFMLQGLVETAEAIRRRGAECVLQHGPPAEVALALGTKAALLVCDRGYLRHQRAWRKAVAGRARCPVVEVESEAVVPVRTASQKQEFGARTLRLKISKLLPRFLQPLSTVELKHRLPKPLNVRQLELRSAEELLSKPKLDRSITTVEQHFTGGTAAAKKRFQQFCSAHLVRYADHRNAPESDDVSRMSAYLHFGQISPLWIALQLQEREREAAASVKSYLEELLVRRELGFNFTEFQEKYDSYECLPQWAQTTLEEHRHDPRPRRYTLEQLEEGRTHDQYWNAAMRQMRLTGYMHNHLRMYWGKKILEWSSNPEEAYHAALWLNNRYFLCGRDPASFANIAWVFGLHDRPWGERSIYGKVRCMMASGLERKCDIKAYVRQMNEL